MKTDGKLCKFLNHKATVHVNTGIAFFALLLFLSCHSVLGFMGHYTFSALPYILGVLLGISCIISLVMTLWKKQDIVLLVTLCWNGFMFLISLAYFLGFSSNYKSIFVEFGEILIFYAFAAIVLYLAFWHHKAKFKGRKAVAVVLLVVLFGGAIWCFTDFNSLHINYVTDGAAVYVVGDEYQIVWRTRIKGTGWVEIGGESYYDTYAGSMRSTTKIHKVSVPQTVLDEAGAYTINSRALLSEQSWSGLQGNKVSKSYTFRPVDTSDGIQFYAVSDVHDYANPAVKAMQYGEESVGKLDFIVMAGDVNNYTESEFDLARILSMANALSGGSRPVVFARGNHELKAVGSESLHQYVGAIGEQFYYTFRLQNVWGIVLDMGEDHADDWYEFYGTALFDDYRAEQLKFVDEVIANAQTEYMADGVEYRVGISHVSTAISPYEEPYMHQTLVELNDRLNRMNLDVMISGHLHQAFKVEAGYEAGQELTYSKEYWSARSTEPAFRATGAGYPSILCSRRNSVLDPSKAESLYGGKFIGAAFLFNGSEKSVRYNNQRGNAVRALAPFGDYTYDTVMYL